MTVAAADLQLQLLLLYVTVTEVSTVAGVHVSPRIL